MIRNVIIKLDILSQGNIFIFLKRYTFSYIQDRKLYTYILLSHTDYILNYLQKYNENIYEHNDNDYVYG